MSSRGAKLDPKPPFDIQAAFLGLLECESHFLQRKRGLVDMCSEDLAERVPLAGAIVDLLALRPRLTWTGGPSRMRMLLRFWHCSCSTCGYMVSYQG
jgi:hypothetical protein